MSAVQKVHDLHINNWYFNIWDRQQCRSLCEVGKLENVRTLQLYSFWSFGTVVEAGHTPYRHECLCVWQNKLGSRDSTYQWKTRKRTFSLERKTIILNILKGAVYNFCFIGRERLSSWSSSTEFIRKGLHCPGITIHTVEYFDKDSVVGDSATLRWLGLCYLKSVLAMLHFQQGYNSFSNY